VYTESEDSTSENKDRPLRPELIDNGASRSLQRNRNDAAESQRHPDAPRLPSRPRQIRCEEWTQAGLHIGKKEVCRFEGMNTLFLAEIYIHNEWNSPPPGVLAVTLAKQWVLNGA
jgi:hypothetical protein